MLTILYPKSKTPWSLYFIEPAEGSVWLCFDDTLFVLQIKTPLTLPFLQLSK